MSEGRALEALAVIEGIDLLVESSGFKILKGRIGDEIEARRNELEKSLDRDDYVFKCGVIRGLRSFDILIDSIITAAKVAAAEYGGNNEY